MFCGWVSEKPLTINYYSGIILHGDRVAPDKCRSPRHFPTKYKMRTTPKGQWCNMEVWKDIRGYEGRYQVSNLGRVKSVERVSTTGQHLHEKVMRTCKDPGGYEFVGFWKDGKKSNFKIHRLVLETFAPVEGMNDLDCNHKDEDKTNNRVENLEWMTRKENLNYGTHNKKISDAHSVRILCVELGKEFNSIQEAAIEFGNCRGNIWRVLDKPNRTACGYHWRYAK